MESTHIDGVDFGEAWPRRVSSTFFGVPVYFIAIEDLIRNKRAAGRPSDLIDLASLERGPGESTR